MKMKTCSMCGVGKPLTEFHLNGFHKGVARYRSACKSCRSKTRIDKPGRTSSNYRTRSRIAAIKGNSKCSRCSESHSACLDFHHVGEKLECVSRMVSRNCAWGSVLDEIAKCEVLCSNCHRKLHSCG